MAAEVETYNAAIYLQQYVAPAAWSTAMRAVSCKVIKPAVICAGDNKPSNKS